MEGLHLPSTPRYRLRHMARGSRVRAAEGGPDDQQRVLVAASTGGHLSELHQLLPRMLPSGGRADWVTFDTPQSRSLLAGERVWFVRGIRPRDLPALLAVLRPAGAILRHRRYAAVVASGAVALPFLPVARAFGVQAHFIEAATRTEEPSLSG